MGRAKRAKISKDVDKVSVRTFGGLSFYYQGSPIPVIWESQKARILFSYLLITNDQWSHRDKFVKMLWPEHSDFDGSNNFKTTLSRLRKSFSELRIFNPVIAQGEAVRINMYDMNVDASQFKQEAFSGIRMFYRGEGKAAKESLEAALNLYQGEFLPEESSDSFILGARKELAELHVSVFRHLERIYQQEGNKDFLDAFYLLNKGILQSLSGN